MPRWIIGAVTMKMMSSTSMTSTIGTTLISASELATRRPRPRRPAPPTETCCTLGMARLCEIPFRDVEEFHREIVHAGREQLYTLRQIVVEEHGRYRGHQTERG